MELHHFFHVYADGDWRRPVAEHIDALRRGGLIDELTTFRIGFVGSISNTDDVLKYLTDEGIVFGIAASATVGWEQVTLDPLYEFTQDHGGLIAYAHTKGAANFNPINDRWRRAMEWSNFINWRDPVSALNAGKFIAGCHWVAGGPASHPGYGTGGMFGGNYWWTRCELLRLNVPPGHESRFAAEHWLGQLSEVMPITGDTIYDMNTGQIGDGLHADWGDWLPT